MARTPSQPTGIGALIEKQAQGHTGLAAVISRAQRCAALTARMCDILPPPLRESASVVAVDEFELVITAPGAAMLTMLRYQSQAILKHLRKTSRITAVKCKVVMAPPVPLAQTKPLSRAIPASAAKQMLTTAEGTTDPTLAAALRRLARHVPK